MKDSFWTIPRQRQLERSAKAGLTAKAIAEQMGLTRSAVCGRAHRTGVKFHNATPKVSEEERQARFERHRLACEERAAARKAQGLPPRGGRAAGVSVVALGLPHGGVDHQTRISALAAYLAGISAPKAAKAHGVYYLSVHNWARNPVLRAEAQAIADRALAALQAEREKRLKEEREFAEWKEELRSDHNAMVRPLVSKRDWAILQHLETGATLQAVGDAFGVTRERIRQIAGRAASRGYDWGGRYTGTLPKSMRPASQRSVA